MKLQIVLGVGVLPLRLGMSADEAIGLVGGDGQARVVVHERGGISVYSESWQVSLWCANLLELEQLCGEGMRSELADFGFEPGLRRLAHIACGRKADVFLGEFHAWEHLESTIAACILKSAKVTAGYGCLVFEELGIGFSDFCEDDGSISVSIPNARGMF